jgi:hypothetical protein
MLKISSAFKTGMNTHLPPIHAMKSAKSDFFSSLGVASNTVLDLLVDAVVDGNPTVKPCDRAVLEKFSKGKWQVCHAPHISTLQKVLGTSFIVSYDFGDEKMAGSKDKWNGALTSNVFYESIIFGSGWLSTAGRVESITDDKCRIIWDDIWWDFNSQQTGPSAVRATGEHVLPKLISWIGKRSFVEGVSIFPVRYLDEDLCVFEFQLFGTKICAKKVF